MLLPHGRSTFKARRFALNTDGTDKTNPTVATGRDSLAGQGQLVAS